MLAPAEDQQDHRGYRGSGGPGQLTGSLRSRLVAIQRGTAQDRHGWVHRLD